MATSGFIADNSRLVPQGRYVAIDWRMASQSAERHQRVRCYWRFPQRLGLGEMGLQARDTGSPRLHDRLHIH